MNSRGSDSGSSQSVSSPEPQSNTSLLRKNQELASTIEKLKQEVTRRKQAEQALNQERLILRTLIDTLPDAVYAKDIEGRKTMANPANAEKMPVQSKPICS